MEELLRKSEESIEVVEREMDWSKFFFFVNDLLPQYHNIRNALTANGITISSLFGSTSIDKSVPTTFVLSVGMDISTDELRQLVNLLRPFGLNGITLNTDGSESRHVYIGSYLYEKMQVTPLNERVIEALANAMRIEDLTNAISTFSKEEWFKTVLPGASRMRGIRDSF